jgi:hypothetical protein
VLAQAAYRRAPASVDQKPTPSFWELAWNWFVDHILRPLLHPIGSALARSQGVGKWVGLILIAVALCALAFLIFRLVLAFVRPRRDAQSLERGVRSLELGRSSADWLALAREAAARGDYERAIAALFAAALAALDERAVIALDPARTPGEYRRLVRRTRADASVAFDELADRYVRAAYAEAAPERADFEAAERAYASFVPKAVS